MKHFNYWQPRQYRDAKKIQIKQQTQCQFWIKTNNKWQRKQKRKVVVIDFLFYFQFSIFNFIKSGFF